MNTDNLGGRAVGAVVAGLVAWLVMTILLWVLSVLLPGITIDASMWATVIGILVALATFFGVRNRV